MPDPEWRAETLPSDCGFRRRDHDARRDVEPHVRDEVGRGIRLSKEHQIARLRAGHQRYVVVLRLRRAPGEANPHRVEHLKGEARAIHAAQSVSAKEIGGWPYHPRLDGAHEVAVFS